MRFLMLLLAALCALQVGAALSAGGVEIRGVAPSGRTWEALRPIEISAQLDADSLSALGRFGRRGAIAVDTGKLVAADLDGRESLVLRQLRVCNFPERLKPRNLLLDGEPLRRGNVFYDRKTQCLEATELDIPLAENVEIKFVERAPSQIECPISYADRNEQGEIEAAACRAPCSMVDAKCVLPGLDEYGYVVDGPFEPTELGQRAPLAKIGDSFYGQSIQNLAFELFQYSDKLLRLKIYDPNEPRYEVPIPLNLTPEPLAQPEYQVRLPAQGDPFAVQIVREASGTVIFDTSVAGITIEDKLLNMAVGVPSRNLYGLGENYHASFRRVFDDKTWPMFSRDVAPNTVKEDNLYGTHPHYVVIEGDGNAHGVLFYSIGVR